MTFRSLLAGTAITATLLVGGATAAVATEGDTGTESPLTCEEATARLEKAQARWTEGEPKVIERVASLQERLQQLTDNGRDKAAERVSRRIDRLENLLERAPERLEKASAHVAEICTADTAS